jgi:DNA mismatch endonuclease (patch repair protein)
MDVFSKDKRAAIMRSVRPRGNGTTEIRLARLFRQSGISGWRRQYKTHGTPDFYFPQLRVAVFVDGCFWHGCPLHATTPATHKKFWKKKLDRNRSRNIVLARTPRRQGVSVVRVWEHELRASVVTKSLERIVRGLRRRAENRNKLPNGGLVRA